MIKVFSHRVARVVFRAINKFLNSFGVVLSKPDFIHGSPAFSGALVLSRRMFQTREILESVSDIEGEIVEGGVHLGVWTNHRVAIIK